MRRCGHMPPAVALGCVPLLGMSAQRRYLTCATAAAMLGGALLSGCSSSTPLPQTTANAYLAAWAGQDWASITAAKTHPTFFEPVFTVTRARYDQLEPTIYPIPGTVFQSSTALSAVTPGLAAGIVGTVGPVTAQELSQLGAPYTAQDDVGQTGLEQADERQLAGTPGATVSVVSAGGAHVATVATLPLQPGTPVTTTIQPSVQRAAEAALAGEKKSAALVAVNASTGAVLAVVSANSGFDQAIDGGFPPGSTFKVITSTALISRGLSPQSAASCPGTATVDGEVFHNAAPRLVTGGASSSGASSPGASSPGGQATGQLPASVVRDLHEMMASVVARGTAAGQGLPSGTYGKTGTAEYGTSKPLKIDAWLMGFKGNIAFAALVVNSAGDGGPTCGPIVARFLNGL